MYVQSLFAEQRPEVLNEFISRHSFGAITMLRGPEVEVDHLPFSVHPSEGSNGILRCHVARTNPLWKALGEKSNVLVVFQGPNAYISPTWMPGRKRHAKVAPSWNYAAVHAYGSARAFEDRDWLRAQLHALITPQEAKRTDLWSLAEAPPEFIDQLLEHIVGIEITVERLVGKWFVGQQRSPNDREGVMTGLLAEGTDAATEVATMMKAYAPASKKD